MNKLLIVTTGMAAVLALISSTPRAEASEPAGSGDAALARAKETAAALAHEVQLLEDENAIEFLQRNYGYFVDRALWKEASELFAGNGTLEIGGRGVFVGKARVLEYLEWLADSGSPQQLAISNEGSIFNHTQLQPVVHVAPDGKTARARWYCIAEVGAYEKWGVWGFNVYENEYVKEDGVWKISSLHPYFVAYTNYKEGWGKHALPNTRPEKTLPPDKPPTLVYDIYPDVFRAPFHYRNPVTGQ